MKGGELGHYLVNCEDDQPYLEEPFFRALYVRWQPFYVEKSETRLPHYCIKSPAKSAWLSFPSVSLASPVRMWKRAGFHHCLLPIHLKPELSLT